MEKDITADQLVKLGYNELLDNPDYYHHINIVANRKQVRFLYCCAMRNYLNSGACPTDPRSARKSTNAGLSSLSTSKVMVSCE